MKTLGNYSFTFSVADVSDELTSYQRYLKVRGVEESIEWYREQFGDDFDREITIIYLKGISEKYDDLPDI